MRSYRISNVVQIGTLICLLGVSATNQAEESSNGFTNNLEDKVVQADSVPMGKTAKAKAQTNSKSAGVGESEEEKMLYELGNDPDAAIDHLGKHKPANIKSSDLPKDLQAYLANKKNGQVYRNEGTEASNPKKAQDALRQSTIESTATSFAAQAGLKWRYDRINEIIKKKYQGRLDEVNFRPFVTNQNVLTPSILIVKDEENYVNDQKMVKTNISFVVADEARIVSNPPTYRDYLIRYYDEPKKIHPILRPQNDEEQAAWQRGIMKGWMIGVRQANEIFNDGLLRMERDIEGRVNYRKMVKLHMISPAALKVTKRGVTFNDRTMNVGETVYEIPNVANFTNLDEWRSAWLREDEEQEQK